jgi:hypothetical protein
MRSVPARSRLRSFDDPEPQLQWFCAVVTGASGLISRERAPVGEVSGEIRQPGPLAPTYVGPPQRCHHFPDGRW